MAAATVGGQRQSGGAVASSNKAGNEREEAFTFGSHHFIEGLQGFREAEHLRARGVVRSLVPAIPLLARPEDVAVGVLPAVVPLGGERVEGQPVAGDAEDLARGSSVSKDKAAKRSLFGLLGRKTQPEGHYVTLGRRS